MKRESSLDCFLHSLAFFSLIDYFFFFAFFFFAFTFSFFFFFEPATAPRFFSFSFFALSSLSALLLSLQSLGTSNSPAQIPLCSSLAFFSASR